MWISKDMDGFVTIWEYKPQYYEWSGNFVGDGQSISLGKKRKLGIDLKRGETKRINLKFELSEKEATRLVW